MLIFFDSLPYAVDWEEPDNVWLNLAARWLHEFHPISKQHIGLLISKKSSSGDKARPVTCEFYSEYNAWLALFRWGPPAINKRWQVAPSRASPGIKKGNKKRQGGHKFTNTEGKKCN